MGPTHGPRNWRLCFRLGRNEYWEIKEQARVLDITVSTLLDWVIRAHLHQTSSQYPEELVDDVARRLGDYGRDQWRKAVEKGLAACADEEVPW